MTASIPIISATPAFTDAYERELANDIIYNLGRDEPSVLLSAFRSIANCTARLLRLLPVTGLAGGAVKATSNSSIPDAFTETQARLILALVKLKATHSSTIEQLVEVFTPTRFTRAQAARVLEILALDTDYGRATLADAMQPCELRQSLRAQGNL
ncbi:hypothetical protein QTI24_22900 [Variovorax sp. J22P240]|uniref:hypothetical protein n=1 Tax=Variovorax sp. J22P240 TaxID=3053514 RepID=UPI002576BE33|nr:hypothetical protein [Variovorax sp. J22P240]MDM0001471.1 hypothetical protein [Variovorax sp. J22P240]